MVKDRNKCIYCGKQMFDLEEEGVQVLSLTECPGCSGKDVATIPTVDEGFICNDCDQRINPV